MEKDNRLTILKEMEKFFKEKSPKLSNQGASNNFRFNFLIEKFMLGDTDMDGFTQLCGQMKGDSHLVCSAGKKIKKFT